MRLITLLRRDLVIKLSRGSLRIAFVLSEHKSQYSGKKYHFVSIAGSGKTYTMQPLPLRAAEDLVRILHQPTYRNQKFKLWLSYFEIYGGKLYDLLTDRKFVLTLYS